MALRLLQSLSNTNDTTTNATMYPLMDRYSRRQLCSQGVNTKLYFNPSSGLLTATGFSGPLTGNVTGNVSGTAGTLATPRAINGLNFDGSAAITVPVNNANDATNATFFPLFTATQGGNYAAKTLSTFNFNPSTGTLTTTAVATNGAASGSVQLSGVTSGSTTLSVTDTGSVLNLGSTNATVDSAGKGTLSGGISTGSAGSTNHAVCWKDTTHIGYCSSVVAVDGTCTCI